jgi:hypothetical protein
MFALTRLFAAVASLAAYVEALAGSVGEANANLRPRTVSPVQGRLFRCAATMTHSSRNGCQRCSQVMPTAPSPHSV